MIKQNANNIRPLLILWEQIRHHQHRHIFPEKRGEKTGLTSSDIINWGFIVKRTRNRKKRNHETQK